MGISTASEAGYEPAQIPANEVRRLAALLACNVLDTGADEAFDDVTLQAAVACEVPIALVSLIDEGRQWFKSHHGLAVSETPRDIAFCSHAILNPGTTLEIPDTANDPRFEGNPLVTGPPFIRFYAGEPLVSFDGHALGTLCIIDTRPRILTAPQRASLRLAARQVEALLDARRAASNAEDAKEAHATEVQALRNYIGERAEFLARAEHSLKTPLSVISGWSSVLASRGASMEESQRQSGLEAMTRAVGNLSHQIEDLLEAARSEVVVSELNLVDVDLAATVGPMVEDLAVISDRHQISFDPGSDTLEVAIDLQAMQQVVAHLVENAVKYSPEGGEVRVDVRVVDACVELSVVDEGIGVPADIDVFEPFVRSAGAKAVASGSGVGLHVVRTLAESMGGTVSATAREPKGSAFTVRLPPAPGG